MTTKPKALLFDLGGVIVPWVGMEALAEFNHITRSKVSDRFDASDAFRAFERGHLKHVLQRPACPTPTRYIGRI